MQQITENFSANPNTRKYTYLFTSPFKNYNNFITWAGSNSAVTDTLRANYGYSNSSATIQYISIKILSFSAYVNTGDALYAPLTFQIASPTGCTLLGKSEQTTICVGETTITNFISSTNATLGLSAVPFEVRFIVTNQSNYNSDFLVPYLYNVNTETAISSTTVISVNYEISEYVHF